MRDRCVVRDRVADLLGRLKREFEDERAALAKPAGGADVAAVFAEDLAAHGQAETGALGSLRGHEQSEDVGEHLGRHAGAVVGNGDPGDARVAVGRGDDRHGGLLPAFHGVEGVGHHVEHRPRHSGRVEKQERQVCRRLPMNRRPRLGRPLLDRLDDVVDEGREVGRQRIGFALFAEGEHVHHQ